MGSLFTFPVEIQAARLRLIKSHPYLASAAWALRPVERPGLGTLAVDMWWRLYFDPAVTTRWTVEELSGVLYHEIMHLLRDHPERMQSLERVAANLAADAEINDNLLAEGVVLPAGAVTPAAIGQPDNLLAEEYYAAIQARESAPGQGTSAQPGNPGESQESSGEPEAGDAQPDSRGDTSGSKAGDSDGSKASDGGDGKGTESVDPSTKHSPSSAQSADSSAQPGDSSQAPAPPGSGHESGSNSRESGDQAQTPAPGAGRCGSCATGQQEPWEDGPPTDGDGVGRAEAEMIRRDVARQIKEHSRGQGDLPGHWARWAEEKLRPKVDWRKELAAAVRHAVADVAGASDYSYRRPSRRQGQVGNGKVILPSLRRPVPSVAVVVDTSGSIDDTMLAQALAEVSGILKSLGQREGIHVLAVDAAVQSCRRVFDARQVQPTGGGGTNMGAGLDAAAKLKPAPQIVVVITDGYTPWPAQPPRQKVIIALTGDGETPKWAKTIRMEG